MDFTCKCRMSSRLAILILLFSMSGISCPKMSAQHFNDTRHQALELTIGPESFLFMTKPTTTMKMTSNEDGFYYTGHQQLETLNISYVRSISRRWDLAITGNIHSSRITKDTYPLISESATSIEEKYDWNATPVSSKEYWVNGALAASFRWKWWIGENVNLYSAVGAGFMTEWLFIPVPYLAPIGVRFGKRRIYGMAELNVSPVSTFFLVGVGLAL